MSKRKLKEPLYSVSTLDFGTTQGTQRVIDAQFLQEIPTITALPRDSYDNAPIDFRVDKTDHFLDLNETYLYLKVAVLHADDSALNESEYITTSNNFAYTMWNNVDVYVNDEKITADNTFYPWMSYVHLLTKCSKRYRDTAMESSIWKEDEKGRLAYNNFTLTDVPINEGAKERAEYIKKSQKVELYARILLDFVSLPQLIPSNTELCIRFVPSNANLSLIHDGSENYKIRIYQAKLYVTKVKLAPYALSHYNQLLNKNGFRYETKRYCTHTKLLQAGEQNVDWFPFTALKHPRRVYVWQIEQAAYNNDATKNLFNFLYIPMNRFQLYCNDVSYPCNVAWQADSKNLVRLYLSTVRAINNPDAWNVDLEAYSGGYFLIVVDITKDQSAASNYKSTISNASLRLIVDYKEPLQSSTTLFCMCEYDDELFIDSGRSPKWQT
jgi:hypothetical protein